MADAEARTGLDLVALTLRAAEAANLAGDHGRAAALIRGAMADVGEADGAGLLWERLGRFLWAAGDSLTALEAYEEAVRLVPPEPPSAARARVLAARGQGLMLLSRHRDPARAARRRSRSRARSAPAPRRATRSTRSAATSATSATRRPRSRICVSAREIAEEVGDLDDLARAYLNLSELLARPLNRLDEALELAHEGIELSRRVGLAGDYGVSLQTTAADVLFGLGRWDEAAASCRRRGAPPDRDGGDRRAPGLREAARRPRATSTPRSAHLDAARRLMAKTVDPQYRAELRAREAELALWQGARPTRARRSRRACAT